MFHSKRGRTTVDRSSFSLLPKHRGQGAFQVFFPFFSLSLQSSFPKCSPSTSLQQMCHFALPSAHFSHFLSSHLPRKFLDSSRPLVRVSSASEVIAFRVDFRLIACFFSAASAAFQLSRVFCFCQSQIFHICSCNFFLSDYSIKHPFFTAKTCQL